MARPRRVRSEKREQMIAEAAYYRAEKRGFDGGDPQQDWIEAEKEIDAQLQGSESPLSLENLELQLEGANKKLKALAKKIGRMKADARKEWEQDLHKLTKLRDTFEKRLEELRDQGSEAGQRAKKRAEKVWEELSEALQRIAARRG